MATKEPDTVNGSRDQTRRAIALIWPVLFCLWFFSFDLPNNRPATRWMVWPNVPFELMDLVDPPVLPNALPWSWLYLGQRLPFLAVAMIIWGGAVCLGRMELRSLRICSVWDRSERFFLAGCLGLSTLSLVMLGLGLLGLLSRWPLLLLIAGVTLAECWWTWHELPAQISQTRHDPRTGWLPVITWSVIVPFVCCMLLGAMSPQTDFDVIEYHLGGPKEWYLQGSISRLPHNVYTSFPFLTEMLLLSGMVCYGDWEWGALAGQAVIAGFAPLTAIGLYGLGKRWFSESAGWLAALVWLTTPWVYRISIIAYAEGGLACYLLATLAVVLRILWTAAPEPTVQPIRWYGLCGLLAGSAMACKYTGLVSVILPAGFLLLISTIRHVKAGTVASAIPSVQEKQCDQPPSQSLRTTYLTPLLNVSVFAAGIGIAIGPWLIKNTLETGNPVFPLAFSLFGGEGRDLEMNEQWKRGHSRHYSSIQERLGDLPVKLTDVVANNDWHSALMFAFAPLALLASWRRRVWLVWGFIGWQFLTWFLLTHQIDRFYVPMFPVVALLAGVGASYLISFVAGRILCSLIMTICIAFNIWIMHNIGGFNAGRTDLRAAANLVVSPSLQWINEEVAAGRLSRDTKVLCIGEAALFHAKFPYVYNTVFDRSIFQQWFAERTETGDFRLRPADQIRATLKQQGITHLLVNWSEILRYREPGSYGYTDFAHPDRLQDLQNTGLIGPALPLPDRVTFAPASSQKRQQVKDWAPSLGISLADQPGYRSVQIFPVR